MIPVLGIYLKKVKTSIQKDTCTPMFIAALFTTGKIWKQPEFIKRKSINKKDVVYIYDGVLHSHKKDEIVPFVTTWIDLEGTILSEIGQIGKASYHMISLICGIKKKKHTKAKSVL